MSGEAQIIVTVRCTWDGDGTSSDPADIQRYNDKMDEVADYCRDIEAWVDGVTLRLVEVTG